MMNKYLVTGGFYLYFIALTIMCLHRLGTDKFMISFIAFFWFYMYMTTNKEMIMNSMKKGEKL